MTDPTPHSTARRAAPPPTPPIPLAALLADRDLGLRRIAGPPDDGSQVVHWVHTSEMADPYPYLLGGELLLTAGVQLSDAYADEYAARVVEAGAAALGFGVTPVYDTVPPALVEACDRHGLPLLEVPPRTPFTTVARGVWRLMAEARHRELRRVTQAQQGLAAAAARQDPVPAVLRQLAVRLGGRAVLFAPDGAELHTTGRAPSPGARTALARLARVVRGGPSSATDTAQGAHLAAYTLGGGQGLVLGVATEGREAGDHTVAGVAVVLLSLLTAPHQSAAEAGRSAALVRLLLGATPAEAAPLLGPGPWSVVHARGGSTPFAAGALAAALGSALVETDGTTTRIVTDREVTARPGWTLGVSEPVEPAELAAADTRAERALRRAEATRTPLVRHHGEGLTGLFAPEEAAAHARTRLAPLTGSPALAETLRVWLSLHGSWDRTAVALTVHRNTVRQRIARCATLLDADLDDADVRMELWFALRWA
ncbi:PucR family transcriptional regulator ligand-binding domain-containing protein [Streptomyces scopuliridis]|uniref:PucR family transcriptional regulator ligand-binding domain-containing protein n=1 Tax=Streptomyces scopuliridis TaxID=452529 RepID=UPI003684E260